jgi:hypothetical protein
VKKYTSIFFLAALFIIIGTVSCKKINEATDLGGDLIPAVDNVNTFEVALNTVTNNLRFNDTTKVLATDYVAAGDLNDPEFGQTHANFHFTILPASLGVYPFVHKDSIRTIDSVVLSLAYQGGYGDTMSGVQTLRVYEIDPNSGFSVDSLYRYADPATNFATIGSELGSKTFSVSSLKDSVTIRTDTTTVKDANVVRIKLDNSLATRFENTDDTSTSGAYHLDSSRGDNFRRLFAGFAIKADNSGNVLTYYNLTNTAKTKLTIYYRIEHPVSGKIDILHADFYHSINGQANYIKQTPGGNWGTYLNNGLASDDKVYLQSSPSGSYASVLIPDLSTLGNKVIHRAELIVTTIPSTSENIFTPPSRLFLDRKGSGTPDTAFLLYRDLAPGADGSLDFNSFGGNLKSGKYIFNITRFLQGVITKHEPIDTLRLFAPLRVDEYAPGFASENNKKGRAGIPVLNKIAEGRVVLGGGSYADDSQRLRLRIIYSNL